MRKFALILAALIVAGVVESAEAANRLQVIRFKVPAIVETATKTAGKVGGDISSFFWRNKVAITTGTVLVTAATNPELVAESVVAAVTRPPTVIVQNGDPTGEYTVVTPQKIRSAGWSGYVFLGGGILALTGMYGYGGRARTIAKVAVVVLLVGFVLFCCNAVRADSFTEIEAMVNVPPWGWKFLWDMLTNILMIVIFLCVPVA